MIRELKVLGLMAATIVAVGAAGPPATAQAETTELTAESYSATIDGTQEGLNVFTRQGRTVDCEVANFHSHVAFPSFVVDVTPEYGSCTSSFGPATVLMNGCKYELAFEGFKSGGVHHYSAVAALRCPAGKKVVIHIYTSHTNHTNNASACVYELPEQPFLTSIALTNKAAGESTPKDWILADVDITGIESTRITGSALLCGSLVDENATLEGSVQLKGTNFLGEANGITMST